MISLQRMDRHHFAWLSIAAAVFTIALKTLAWWVTGSVGLLSDALESFVNLAGAPVLLDVVAQSGHLDAQHPGHLVLGHPLAVQGEHPVEIGEGLPRCGGQLGSQLPATHAEAPGAYLRR